MIPLPALAACYCLMLALMPAGAQPTTAPTAAAGQAPAIQFVEQPSGILPGDPTRSAMAGTTVPITLRLNNPDGTPARQREFTAMVLSQPDSMQTVVFDPATVVTDRVGEARLVVGVPNRTGRYELALATGTPENPGPIAGRFVILARTRHWGTMLLLSLAGAVAVFLYGLRVISEGLIELAGRRLRTALTEFTRSPLRALGAGFVLTLMTQSSGATTLLLMSFLRARMLDFIRAFPVVLGAAIAGTVTIQLLSFDLAQFALPAVGTGFLLHAFGRTEMLKNIGHALFGFGLIFFGLDLASNQMLSLKGSPAFDAIIHALTEYPLGCVVVTALFTAAAQGTGAALGIVLALARQDLLTLEESIPFFFGASVGICFTGLAGTLGAPPDARRLAWGHLLYKIVGVLLFLPLVAPLASVGQWVTEAISPHPDVPLPRAIANTYTLFITATALLALPLTPLIGRVMNHFISEETEKPNGGLRTKYLDTQLYDNPVVALGSAVREISRMGRFVEEMIKQAGKAILDKDQAAFEFTSLRDNKVDYLNRQITGYLTKLSLHLSHDPEIMGRTTTLLFIVDDLESIGDIIDKNLVPIARKTIDKSVAFSAEGAEDISQLHQRVTARLSQVVIAIATSDKAIAEPVITGFQALQDEGRRLHIRHLERLRGGHPDTVESSSAHLDAINYLLRIDFLVFDIALHLAGRTLESLRPTEPPPANPD